VVEGPETSFLTWGAYSAGGGRRGCSGERVVVEALGAASSDPIDLRHKQLQLHELPLMVLRGHHMDHCQSPLGVQADSTRYAEWRRAVTLFVWCPSESRASPDSQWSESVIPGRISRLTNMPALGISRVQTRPMTGLKGGVHSRGHSARTYSQRAYGRTGR
jgi:hypothetical protein